MPLYDIDEYALTTLEAVKLQLGIAEDDTTLDDILTGYINGVSAAIERACNRKFLARNITEFYDGPEDNVLILNENPVNSVASVYVDHNRVFDASSLLTVNVDYVVKEAEGWIELIDPGFRSWGFGSAAPKIIKVTYNFGHAQVPNDVQMAATLAVQYFKTNSKSLNIKSISIGSFSQSFGDMKKFPEAVQDLLKPHVRLTVA